jgi:FXSXX-COOH protein
MESDAGSGTGIPEQDSHLPDVTGVPLVELLASHDAALTGSLRRLLADLDTHERFSSFANFVEPDRA